MFSRSESDIVSSSIFHALIVPLNGRYVMLISISQYRFITYIGSVKVIHRADYRSQEYFATGAPRATLSAWI